MCDIDSNSSPVFFSSLSCCFGGFVFLLVMLFFFGHPTAYGVPGPRDGIRSKLQLRRLLQLQQPFGSLTHRAGPGIKPVSQHSRAATDPLCLNRNSSPLVLVLRKPHMVYWFVFTVDTGKSLLLMVACLSFQVAQQHE